MSDKDKNWLIKDQDLIQGPFSQEEVQEQLKKGHFSPFATACQPGQTFWGFLSGYPEFASWIDQTKLTQLTTSLTKTEDTTAVTFTKTKDTVLKARENKSEVLAEGQSLPYQVIKEAKEQKKPTKALSSFLAMSVLLIFIVLGGGYYFLSQKAPAEKESLIQIDEGQAWFLAGHYQKAFKIWQSAPPISDPQAQSFKILKLRLNNDISVSHSLLRETKGEVQALVQALTLLKSGDITMARQSWQKWIDTSASKDIKQSAYANMALLSAKEGRCDFFKGYQPAVFGHKALIDFLFAFCLLPSSSSEDKKKAKELLEPIAKKQQSYYQEALLGMAYLQMEEGTLEPTLIQKILDSDPYLTNMQSYPVWIDRGIYSWTEILPLCQKIYSAEKMDQLFVSLYAYCLSRARLYEEALMMIKTAEFSDPESALVKSLHAYMADLVHLKNESAQILGYALKFNGDRRYVLPYILQARFCEQNQNWACASENWGRVLKQDPNSLSGLGGIAYAKYKQGHAQEAKEYMNQGLSLSEGALYSPLLFLKRHYRPDGSQTEQSKSKEQGSAL